MRNLKTQLGTLTLVTLLFSCSSVKVTDSWKDIKTADIKNKNIMVVSKTDSETVRLRFEKDMVEGLNNTGYNAVESYTLFPEMEPIKEGEKKQIQKLKKDLKEKDIDVVVMTVLRDYQEYTKTVTTGSSYHISTFPVYFGGYGRHYRGFYGYYGSFYMHGAPETTVTSTGKKYILETLVYDLTQPEDNQLLTIITSEIDNPETLGTSSKDFSKQIVKVFSK